MTRAKEWLGIFSLADSGNPHVKTLSHETCLDDCRFNSHDLHPEPSPPGALAIQNIYYEILPLRDIFLDYAGRTSPTHPIHTALKELGPGNELRLVQTPTMTCLCTQKGIPVAAMARGARQQWNQKQDSIKKIRILAMVQRKKTDCQPDFIPGIVCEKWEIPIVEIHLETV